MRRDVIAVCMRDKREWLSIPGIEPKVFVRQINAAVVTNFDHEKFYARNCAGETGIRARSSWGCIDSALRFPFHEADEGCDDFSFGSGLGRQRPGCGRAKAVIEGGPITNRLE